MRGLTLRPSAPAPEVWSLVDAAAALEPAPSVRAIGYDPHLTLVRYGALATDRLLAGLAAAANAAPLRIALTAVRAFDTDPLVLWLEPAEDAALRRLHAAVHAAAGADGCDPHYAPDAWRPHLTLAAAVPRSARAEALAFTRRRVDVRLTFDVVDALDWPPVTVVGSRGLG